MLKFLDLNLFEKSKEHNFKNFTKYINNKEVLNKTELLLKTINKEKYTREFLSLYLFLNKSNIILNKLKNYDISNLIDRSQKLIKCLKKDYNKTEFKNNFQNYLIELNLWKKYDCEKLVNSYIDSYYALNILQKNSKVEHKNLLQPIKKKIKKCILSLDKINGQKKLNNYKLVVDNNLKKILAMNIRKAFWNKLKLDLEKTPPKLDMIKDLLIDVNKALMCITFSKQLKKEINDKFDVLYLTKLIKNNLFTFDAIIGTSLFLLNTIQRLTYKSRDKLLKEHIDFVNNIYKNPQKFIISEYLPKMFKIILEEIELITFKILEINNNLKEKNITI